MNRKIAIIILSAVAFALLVGLIWFFFFRAAATLPANNGAFGAGADKTTSTTGKTNNINNIPSGVLNDPSGTSGATVTGVVNNNSDTSNAAPSVTTYAGIPSVPGVDWLGGSGGGSGGGKTTNFVPSAVNQLNNGVVSGTPGLVGSFGSNADSVDGLGLGGALLGAGIAGSISCGSFLIGGLGGVFTSASFGTVQTNVPVKNTEDFLDCITRVIAKVAIQQMTNSIVNWINSGFNGQPSFVRNYQQFFTNVADVAAGEFIRGSSLSFLCSPFKLQIRIAVAQSYARRSNAPSCSLSSVIKNIDGFMKGNFSQGGWGGLLSFTGIPTNNPFGAYQDGLARLNVSVSSAVGRKQQDYVIGKGFLSSEKKVNCKEVNGAQKCDTVVVTPGSTIAESLNKTLGVGQDSLNLAKSFDEIISALITQLMVKTLQSGLASLSGTQGYAANYLTPEQQQAQADAQIILTDMQGRVQLAQQYGSVMQGSISDIQNAQQQLHVLFDCYSGKGKNAEASSTQEIIDSYEISIDAYNNKITLANEGIVLLQNLQTQAINVASVADVAAVKNAYQNALASGAIVTQADVTNAQQDRATLQSNIEVRNSATAAALQQCYALN